VEAIVSGGRPVAGCYPLRGMALAPASAFSRRLLIASVVFGLSLKGRGTMRFRPLDQHVEPRQTLVLELEPRSLYVMQGPIRWLWQHSMLAARELRYSITFRTRANDEPQLAG